MKNRSDWKDTDTYERRWLHIYRDDLSQAPLILFLLLIATLYSAQLFAQQVSPAEPIKPLIAPSAENVQKVALGKQLFHDPRLSSDNTVSCSSCHSIVSGGDDNMQFSQGVNQQLSSVNSPSVFNSVNDIAQFWDGRAANLSDQIHGPLTNPAEMNATWDQVIGKLRVDASLVSTFYRVYGEPISEARIIDAIVTYQAQLITLNAPFDDYLKGDETAISENAKQGYRLFKSLGCTACHQGQNVGGNMFQEFGVSRNYFSDLDRPIDQSDFGRYNVTGRESDKYKFKVPSLRNVAQTAPYFHDGSAETLEEAIRVMARYQLGRPIKEQQVVKLAGFLQSLTGSVREELK